jgi:hypothetical protein
MPFWNRKPRRPRGPHTPQARALNWKLFASECAPRLQSLGIPESVWRDPAAFEAFLATGQLPDGTAFAATDALRELAWHYRKRTKSGLAPAFFERSDAPSRLREEDLLELFRRSDRWGVNSQPDDPAPLAQALAALPLWSAEARPDGAYVVRFLRPLTEGEAQLLLQTAGWTDHPDESPFVEGQPRLQAVLWWD